MRGGPEAKIQRRIVNALEARWRGIELQGSMAGVYVGSKRLGYLMKLIVSRLRVIGVQGTAVITIGNACRWWGAAPSAVSQWFSGFATSAANSLRVQQAQLHSCCSSLLQPHCCCSPSSSFCKRHQELYGAVGPCA